jgi:hypothetical protein
MTARTSIEQRVYTLLSGTAAVTALVGTRIYPTKAQQAALLPQLVYRRVSTSRVYSLAGESGVEMCRIQVDCQDDDFAGARALAAAVLDAFNGATSFASTPDGDVSGYESDPEIYTVSLDFQCTNYEW